jgi:short-subunit dehydrogenase
MQAYKTFTLITGASGGLGAEFARLCAADGHNLILVARRGDKLRELAASLGDDITIHIIVQDLSEHGAAEKVYKKVRRLRAIVDQLINNAGFGDYAPLGKAMPARQEHMIGVNVTTLTLLTSLFLPSMIKQKHGRILNVGSIVSFIPYPNMSVYAASKSYVLSFSEALSEELRGSGVTVTCLCPGATSTGFARAAHLAPSSRIARSKISAATVARAGYRAMLAGTPIVVHGTANRLFAAFVIRILPRAMMRRAMRLFDNG